LKLLGHKTLLDALRAAGDAGAALTWLQWDDPEQVLPVATRVTYAQLWERCLRTATELRQRGVKPGSHVLTLLPNGLEFIATFFALQVLGAVPVPLPYPAPFDDPDTLLWNIERILERTHGGLMVLSPPLAERWADEPRLAGLACFPPTPGTAEVLAEQERHEPTPDDLAFVQFTSGSTGHPKGVKLSHRQLLANCAAIGMGVNYVPGEVGVIWLPLCHDMGLIGGLFSTMCHQLDLVLMSPFDFVVDPLRWLWALSEYKAAITCAPNFGYALCVRARRTSQDATTFNLSPVRVAMCGAEPVNAEMLGKFVERYGAQGFKGNALFPVYGLAEASLAVTFPAPGTDVSVDHVDRNALSDARRAIPTPAGMPWTAAITGLGRAVAGHSVRIMDDHGKLRADREVGEIVVKGPSLTSGYLRDAEATHAILKEGWLHTGDLGYLVDGQLHVCGRKKDVIIFRGRKYYPQDLERAAQDVDGVRKGNVVAFGEMDPAGGVERVTLVAETRGDDVENANVAHHIKARVQECCGVPVEHVVLLRPGELPKTPSGKVRRNECRVRFGLVKQG
jgi:acyl-CoA synthetase (AMP-forming)/AMP-acid ligase II